MGLLELTGLTEKREGLERSPTGLGTFLRPLALITADGDGTGGGRCHLHGSRLWQFCHNGLLVAYPEGRRRVDCLLDHNGGGRGVGGPRQEEGSNQAQLNDL